MSDLICFQLDWCNCLSCVKRFIMIFMLMHTKEAINTAEIC